MYWGPSYWRFLHYFALHDSGRELFEQLPKFMPCDVCRSEWVNPGPKEDLVMWSKELHNRVNKKLGKYDKWDMTDFEIAHKPECDYESNKEYVHLFPWLFLHTVAETGGDGALLFLKHFNETYPNIVLRGKFFTDDPAEGESVLDWTVRHHNRMNLDFGRGEYLHPKKVSGDQVKTSGDNSDCCGAAGTSAQTTPVV